MYTYIYMGRLGAVHQVAEKWLLLDVTRQSSQVFISRKVFMKVFCKSQFPHKSVNLFFIVSDVKKS